MPFPHTDVLVLGSGLAGLCAAVYCRRQGLDVLVCSKSKPGLGSCSAISQGHFRASIGDFGPEEHKNLTLQAGKGLNQLDKLQALTENAARDVQELQEFGVTLAGRAKGYDCQAKQLGLEGRCITRPMTRQAESLGVRFQAPFFAWRIAVQDNRAVGVWGFEPGKEEPVLLTCRSLILATGGAGSIYAQTDNPQGMIGDGYALSLEAGLSLMDMEFVQFYPLCTGQSRTSLLLPPLLGEVGTLENAQAEDIVSKYGIQTRPLAIAARDELCQAMALEAEAGLVFPDGSLRLRLQQKDSIWREARKTFGVQSTQALRSWAEKLAAKQQGSISIKPAAHFCMGGIAGQADAGTPIQGLFAAGEVTGGLHGANRLGGNALAETAVFGKLAAQGAAQAACDLQDPHWSKLEPAPQFSTPPVEDPGQSISQLRQKLQMLIWLHAGILRSKESLESGLKELDVLKTEFERHAPAPRSRIKALELANMLQVAKAILTAALAREESRGSHYRSDFPHTDQALDKHIYPRLQEGRLQLDW
ncbi:MAG: FAD-dependent oxidoreductase [Desulfohalobiaceae bacterium]